MCSAEAGGNLHDAVAVIRREVGELTAPGNGSSEVSQEDVVALFAAAVRLYATRSADPYGPETLAELSLTPTEACTAAAALLESQSLTPFEFAIWFSGGRVGSNTDRQ